MILIFPMRKSNIIIFSLIEYFATRKLYKKDQKKIPAHQILMGTLSLSLLLKKKWQVGMFRFISF